MIRLYEPISITYVADMATLHSGPARSAVRQSGDGGSEWRPKAARSDRTETGAAAPVVADSERVGLAHPSQENRRWRERWFARIDLPGWSSRRCSGWQWRR